MNVVKVLFLLAFVALVICSARAVVNPDGGVCRYPSLAQLFKMCRD